MFLLCKYKKAFFFQILSRLIAIFKRELKLEETNLHKFIFTTQKYTTTIIIKVYCNDWKKKNQISRTHEFDFLYFLYREKRHLRNYKEEKIKIKSEFEQKKKLNIIIL